MRNNNFQFDENKDWSQIFQTPRWVDATGKHSEIVLASKVRVARNISNFKFPDRATSSEKTQIFDFISQHLKHLFIPLHKLSSVDRECMVERYIVRREFLTNIEGKGIGVYKDKEVNFIINDQEHLKIQYTLSGLDLMSAYKEVDNIDTEISKLLPYGFSPQFGYLTALPTNTGTALRVSTYLHLPGLVHSERLKKLIDKLQEVGFFVRTLAGEGTKVEGNFFEITNRTTLGRTEEELVDGLDKTIVEIVEHEQEARNILFKNAKLQLEDKIWRAYAILKNSRLLSLEEFINLSSAVRLGVGEGILKGLNLKTLNELLIYVQPAHLKRNAERLSTQNLKNYKLETNNDIDNYRAFYVRAVFSKN